MTAFDYFFTVKSFLPNVDRVTGLSMKILTMGGGALPPWEGEGQWWRESACHSGQNLEVS